MKFFKRQPKESQAEQASNPPIQAGHFGHFPTSFSIYFGGFTPDKKSKAYYLVSTDNAGGTPLQVFQTFLVHQGMVKHQITLHTTASPTSPPLAFVGVEKLFSSKSILTLPGEGSSGSPSTVVQMRDAGGLRREAFRLEYDPNSRAGGKKTLEWRRESMLQVPAVRELFIVETGEAVAQYREEQHPERTAKLGEVHIVRPDSLRDSGGLLMLMSVVSLLRVNQGSWEASTAAESMIEAAGRLMSKGLSIAL